MSDGNRGRFSALMQRFICELGILTQRIDRPVPYKEVDA